MKLKLDCVKSVLEEIEGLPIGLHEIATLKKSIVKYGEEDVLYTVTKLSEASYINALLTRTEDGRPHIDGIMDLTFAGHEFLNSIRTPGIWERLKGAANEGGTECLKAIWEISVEIIKQTTLKKLGFK